LSIKLCGQKLRIIHQLFWSLSACCPAHDDISPSLSIREVDDGRILIHCFSGCEVHSVVAAVGLELSDLFPKTNGKTYKPVRRRIDYRAAFNACRRGYWVMVLAPDSQGKPLSAADLQQFNAARQSILNVLEQIDE
jgi:hypothetical protein